MPTAPLSLLVDVPLPTPPPPEQVSPPSPFQAGDLDALMKLRADADDTFAQVERQYRVLLQAAPQDREEARKMYLESLRAARDAQQRVVEAEELFGWPQDQTEALEAPSPDTLSIAEKIIALRAAVIEYGRALPARVVRRQHLEPALALAHHAPLVCNTLADPNVAVGAMSVSAAEQASNVPRWIQTWYATAAFMVDVAPHCDTLLWINEVLFDGRMPFGLPDQISGDVRTAAAEAGRIVFDQMQAGTGFSSVELRDSLLWPLLRVADDPQSLQEAVRLRVTSASDAERFLNEYWRLRGQGALPDPAPALRNALLGAAAQFNALTAELLLFAAIDDVTQWFETRPLFAERNLRRILRDLSPDVLGRVLAAALAIEDEPGVGAALHRGKYAVDEARRTAAVAAAAVEEDAFVVPVLVSEACVLAAEGDRPEQCPVYDPSTVGARERAVVAACALPLAQLQSGKDASLVKNTLRAIALAMFEPEVANDASLRDNAKLCTFLQTRVAKNEPALTASEQALLDIVAKSLADDTAGVEAAARSRARNYGLPTLTLAALAGALAGLSTTGTGLTLPSVFGPGAANMPAAVELGPVPAVLEPFSPLTLAPLFVAPIDGGDGSEGAGAPPPPPPPQPPFVPTHGPERAAQVPVLAPQPPVQGPPAAAPSVEAAAAPTLLPLAAVQAPTVESGAPPLEPLQGLPPAELAPEVAQAEAVDLVEQPAEGEAEGEAVRGFNVLQFVEQATEQYDRQELVRDVYEATASAQTQPYIPQTAPPPPSIDVPYTVSLVATPIEAAAPPVDVLLGMTEGDLRAEQVTLPATNTSVAFESRETLRGLAAALVNDQNTNVPAPSMGASLALDILQPAAPVAVRNTSDAYQLLMAPSLLGGLQSQGFSVYDLTTSLQWLSNARALTAANTANFVPLPPPPALAPGTYAISNVTRALHDGSATLSSVRMGQTSLQTINNVVETLMCGQLRNQTVTVDESIPVPRLPLGRNDVALAEAITRAASDVGDAAAPLLLQSSFHEWMNTENVHLIDLIEVGPTSDEDVGDGAAPLLRPSIANTIAAYRPLLLHVVRNATAAYANIPPLPVDDVAPSDVMVEAENAEQVDAVLLQRVAADIAQTMANDVQIAYDGVAYTANIASQYAHLAAERALGLGIDTARRTLDMISEADRAVMDYAVLPLWMRIERRVQSVYETAPWRLRLAWAQEVGRQAAYIAARAYTLREVLRESVTTAEQFGTTGTWLYDLSRRALEDATQTVVSNTERTVNELIVPFAMRVAVHEGPQAVRTALDTAITATDGALEALQPVTETMAATIATGLAQALMTQRIGAQERLAAERYARQQMSSGTLAIVDATLPATPSVDPTLAQQMLVTELATAQPVLETPPVWMQADENELETRTRIATAKDAILGAQVQLYVDPLVMGTTAPTTGAAPIMPVLARTFAAEALQTAMASASTGDRSTALVAVRTSETPSVGVSQRIFTDTVRIEAAARNAPLPTLTSTTAAVAKEEALLAGQYDPVPPNVAFYAYDPQTGQQEGPQPYLVADQMLQQRVETVQRAAADALPEAAERGVAAHDPPPTAEPPPQSLLDPFENGMTPVDIFGVSVQANSTLLDAAQRVYRTEEQVNEALFERLNRAVDEGQTWRQAGFDRGEYSDELVTASDVIDMFGAHSERVRPLFRKVSAVERFTDLVQMAASFVPLSWTLGLVEEAVFQGPVGIVDAMEKAVAADKPLPVFVADGVAYGIGMINGQQVLVMVRSVPTDTMLLQTAKHATQAAEASTNTATASGVGTAALSAANTFFRRVSKKEVLEVSKEASRFAGSEVFNFVQKSAGVVTRAMLKRS